jgi:hypothetical protein
MRAYIKSVRPANLPGCLVLSQVRDLSYGGREPSL